MHYVTRNDWKRPTQAQVEAIAAEEINADELASKKAVPLAQIPSDQELEELTKDMTPQRAYDFEEAMECLKDAVEQGKEAIREQGHALLLLKQACEPRRWGKVLQAIKLPRTTAHRQIQIAKARAASDSKLRKILIKKGIRFDSNMSAQHCKLVCNAAQVAKDAKAEAEAGLPDLFHDGTNSPANDNWLGESQDPSPREQQIEAVVEEKVTAFVEKELNTGALSGQKARPSRKPP